MNPQFLLQQILFTLRDPRGAARWVMSIDMARIHRWELLGLVMLLGVFVTHFSAALTIDTSIQPTDPFEAIMRELILNRPYIHALLQMSILVVTVFAMFWVSKICRGTGGFAPGILLVAWVEFVMISLRIVQLLVWLISPSLAGIIGVGALAAAFWLISHFIAELHGFKSLFLVFIMIIVTAFGFLFGFAFILALIGVSFPGVAA